MHRGLIEQLLPRTAPHRTITVADRKARWRELYLAAAEINFAQCVGQKPGTTEAHWIELTALGWANQQGVPAALVQAVGARAAAHMSTSMKHNVSNYETKIGNGSAATKVHRVKFRYFYEYYDRELWIVHDVCVAKPGARGAASPPLCPARHPPQSVAACPSIVAGRILPRMGTKSRETIYGGSVRAAAERATEARKEADRLAVEAWNKRMLGFQGPAQPSPALGDAINAGFG